MRAHSLVIGRITRQVSAWGWRFRRQQMFSLSAGVAAAGDEGRPHERCASHAGRRTTRSPSQYVDSCDFQINRKNRTFYYRAYRFSIRLKKKYPEWGAPFILTLLAERYPNESFPSPRTLQKWFKKNHLQKPPVVRPRPQAQNQKVLNVHDCWQIDAKENIHLKDGTKACYLTTVDVKSGIALGTPLFSHRQNQPSQASSCAKGVDCFIPKMGNAQNYSSR